MSGTSSATFWTFVDYIIRRGDCAHRPGRAPTVPKYSRKLQQFRGEAVDVVARVDREQNNGVNRMGAKTGASASDNRVHRPNIAS